MTTPRATAERIVRAHLRDMGYEGAELWGLSDAEERLMQRIARALTAAGKARTKAAGKRRGT